MYNTLFGVNYLASVCLSAVDILVLEVERFRDAIFFKKGKKHFVEVLTRTGGKNRENFPNKSLKENKNYVEDYDDEYDNTYAHFIFQVPEKLEQSIYWDRVFKDQSRNSLNLKKMFNREFKEMSIPGTEAFSRAEKVAAGFKKLIESESDEVQTISIEDLMHMGEKELNKGDKDGRKR